MAYEFADECVREQSKGTLVGRVAAMLIATALSSALLEWVAHPQNLARPILLTLRWR